MGFTIFRMAAGEHRVGGRPKGGVRRFRMSRVGLREGGRALRGTPRRNPVVGDGAERSTTAGGEGPWSSWGHLPERTQELNHDQLTQAGVWAGGGSRRGRGWFGRRRVRGESRCRLWSRAV
jgi:hypothetical protein